MKLIDLTGQKFGKLTVIERVANRGCKVAWKCICSCGKETIATSSDLKQGNVASCGCYKRDKCKQTHTKHGKRYEKIWYVWHGMKSRCSYTKHKDYKNYGGRGITVCDEWKNDFQAFYDYVSKLPHFGEEGYSVDRIDNDGNYEPGNVKWSTANEQRKNRRDSK